MNRKGFTLLELIVVLIVLAALVAIALPQYTGFVEKAKASEAIAAIGAIKTGEDAYRAMNASNNYVGCADAAAINTTLGILLATGSWLYATTASGNTLTITATRTGGGSNNGYTVIHNYVATGANNWGGNHTGAPK